MKTCLKTRAQVSILLLGALMEVLQQRGIAIEALLAAATESISVESSTSRLPLASYKSLLARAAVLANEPALGLLCGQQAAQSSFGLVGPLVSHTSSLRRGLELMGRFQVRVWCNSLQVSLAAARAGSRSQAGQRSHPPRFCSWLACLRVASPLLGCGSAERGARANMSILAPCVLGLVFGWSLQRAGLTHYARIVNVFRFRDLTVLRFMLSALLVGAAGYCPGTIVAEAGEGRLDAWLAGLSGLIVVALAFGLLQPSLMPVLARIRMLGRVSIAELCGASPWLVLTVFAELVLIVLRLTARVGHKNQ